MKHLTLATAAVLFALAAPAAAQDVTPAIDPGMAGIAAANRESLDREAARSGGSQHRTHAATARRGARMSRPGAERRRAIRRARRRAATGW